ncbi:MAG: carboxylating nicotinate-nucleotide diphosphorylase [Bacteroidales bacterium]|jgi:nicotinate-nucleotide pyrophosphorylase (carboxylating)|nr:carboxylating nicotinate-nucleotide diphosphorylase [Bacteroidales bacterium]
MDIVAQHIAQALAEDIGEGDHTSRATIPEDAIGKMKLLVKEDGIIAGIEIAKKVFNAVDNEIVFNEFISDGDEIKKGDIVFIVTGNCRSMLIAERTMLNYMQRMSGIATVTHAYIKQLAGTNTRLLDTRKTTPNMRIFEKMAVAIGGGKNHRMGLYDMVMIKDNHVDFAGGIKQAIIAENEYLKKLGKKLKIEIEVRNFTELEEVLNCGSVHRIMLDNFTPQDLKKAVKMIQGRYETEASGGINLTNIREYALTGVDFISVGAVTHHIRSLDLSLKAIE